MLIDEAVVPEGVAEREPLDVEEVLPIDELVGLDAEPGLAIQSLELRDPLLEAHADSAHSCSVDIQVRRHPIVREESEAIEILLADLHFDRVHHRVVEQCR